MNAIDKKIEELRALVRATTTLTPAQLQAINGIYCLALERQPLETPKPADVPVIKKLKRGCRRGNYKKKGG